MSAQDAPPAGNAAPRVSIAPMMDWTDRHCRYFHRLLAPQVRLYTEMVTAAAIVHGDRARLLAYHPAEHPVDLQLGGSDPELMAEAAGYVAEAGFDRVNINVGCPSERVKSGSFGACLMAEPDLVAACVRRMRETIDLPVTVKSRIGIDDHEDYSFLKTFVEVVAAGGCREFVVHARKAILAGLSPKQNREVPPLRYEVVHRLKQDFPGLVIVINGGIRDLEGARRQLALMDGVMIGREAYKNPWFLAQVERDLLGGVPPASRVAVVEAMLPYFRQQLESGQRLHSITRHMLGLFTGQPGARAWRRHLSEEGARPGAGVATLEAALDQVAGAA
jgi:tRNA-dihydrouridine synthase A